MIKIFGYNILTDLELERFEKNHWETVKKYLKIKELFRIRTEYIKKPKCSSCDEHRQIKVKMPDGSFKKINCSCDSTTKKYSVSKVDDCQIKIAAKKTNGKIYIYDGYSEWAFEYRVIFNKKEINTENIGNSYFASRKLAEYALKIIKSREVQDEPQS